MNQDGKKKTTIVIGLYGASGVGKTTAAWMTAAALKMLGYHVEMVHEFAKELAHHGYDITWKDQAWIFGEQSHREAQFYGKLDVIVTDSPLLFCGFYEDLHLGHSICLPAIQSFMKYAEKNDGVHYLNFWLTNYEHFDPRGRFEKSIEDSKANHHKMRDWLTSHGVNLIDINVPHVERAGALVAELERYRERLVQTEIRLSLEGAEEASAGGSADGPVNPS